MKTALAQINYHIGNFEENISKIKQQIQKAKQEQAELIVFAELAISGYPPRDFLEFDDFIHRCTLGIENIAKECHGIAAIIGAPSVNTEKKGKPLYNSAYFLAVGKIMAVRHKTLLPTYDIFDEYRYFEPNRNFELIEYKGKKIALTICEDLWNLDEDPLYIINPMDELIKLQPDMIVNIAASPFNYNQKEIRKNVLIRNAKKYHLPVYYVNHVGAQTELLFDGGSTVVDAQGNIVDELNSFEEDFRVYPSLKKSERISSKNKNQTISSIALIHDALVMGIKNYFEKQNFKKAILGLSGGIDSAVTLVLAARALGKENVRAVLMPSEFSSEHSVKDAKNLAENLDVKHDIIGIHEVFDVIDKNLKPYFEERPFNIAEENIQSRIRGILLMALSNKFGYILLNTSNKSEIAVGYGTLYGDMCGGLSVLGDIYKTQVYELAQFINKEKEIIPLNTILKPPSAELRPDQKDSDSLPDYDILDKILYQYIELRKGPNEIIAMGFDEKIVSKTLKLVNTSEFKRHQTPPILRVSPKAFGMGRRMPIVAKYLS